ncbi:MAG: hypothetical protein H0U00_15410 [Actinobacteria bacterium]|nr:hypothetical protein [Actinomycetota bacterium]
MTERIGDSTMGAVSAWQPILDGFDENVGGEKGIVRLDEEHPNGARITLEEGGVSAPWSVTCGVYGLMVHTAFFGSETDARKAVFVMKARLAAIMDAMGSDRIYDLVERFVADF